MARAEFTGTRSDLFALLFRGHLLMLPTLGIYRFWLVTWKRRFYWQNTVIDGDALEYTGHALQLLLGFLFAIGFFLPIYIVFFYLSTQSSEVALLGYGAVALGVWFLTGYASYRGRDFRLSRTLWRGVRFDQKGSAWGYAFRRFGWSLLVIATLGLAYPFMAGNLWSYRWRHTWFGDQQVTFTGSWRKIAGPYYLIYFGLIITAIATLGLIGATNRPIVVGDSQIPGIGTWFFLLVQLLLMVLAVFYLRAREATRMFSSIHLGKAAVTVQVTARALIGQYLLCMVSFGGALLLFVLIAAAIAGSLVTLAMTEAGTFDPSVLLRILETGWITVAALILAYLALVSAFAILTETILGYGYWALVARNATISNADSLRSIRTVGEDTAVAGEGLADALNVGAY